MPTKNRYIEILIETSTSWGRGLVLGVSEYARTQPSWHLGLYPSGRTQQLRLKKSWAGDGVIARVNSPELADEIRQKGVPAVNVSTYLHGSPEIPQCTANEKVMGELAAAHLLDCGLQHFAYYGPSDRPSYEDRVGDVFVQIIRERGFDCHLAHRIPEAREQLVRQGAADHVLAQWLKLLPQPVGLFTWSDMQGLRVIEACRSIGLRVPEDVAILSGETDELMAAVARPSLSSVDPAPSRVGYEAAAMLHQMLDGVIPDQPIRHVPPAGIIARGSTDISTVTDPLVLEAIAYIHSNLSSKFGVEDVCRHVGVSRRSLETHFQNSLNRTPAAEISRIRIGHAKKLIMDTELSIQQISQSCGYDFAETFSRAFKRESGMSPREFQAMARVKRGREPDPLAGRSAKS